MKLRARHRLRLGLPPSACHICPRNLDFQGSQQEGSKGAIVLMKWTQPSSHWSLAGGKMRRVVATHTTSSDRKEGLVWGSRR